MNTVFLIAAFLYSADLKWEDHKSKDFFFARQLDDYDPDRVIFECRLSDVDKSITGNKEQTNRPLKIASIHRSIELDEFLVQSPTDSCGLTYIVTRKLRKISLNGVLLKRPARFESNTIKSIDSTTYSGYKVEEINEKINGRYRPRPSKAVIQAIKQGTTSAAALDSIKRLAANNLIADSNRIEAFFEAFDENQPACRKKAVSNSEPGTIEQNDVPPVFVIKPMIYLYPTKQTNIDVFLDSRIKLTATYPKATNGGWKVSANPLGELTDLRTGKNFYGLFWDAQYWHHPNVDSGFVNNIEDFPEVLDSLLEIKGLNYKERNECVTFWLAKFSMFPWVKFSFHDEKFAEDHPVAINPKPETFIRVFIVFRPMQNFQKIPPQKIEQAKRIGFTAIEWGGEVSIEQK